MVFGELVLGLFGVQSLLVPSVMPYDCLFWCCKQVQRSMLKEYFSNALQAASVGGHEAIVRPQVLSRGSRFSHAGQIFNFCLDLLSPVHRSPDTQQSTTH